MKCGSAMDNGCFKNAGVTSPEENDDAFCLFEVGVCGVELRWRGEELNKLNCVEAEAGGTRVASGFVVSGVCNARPDRARDKLADAERER
ncbi:hypothetical protein QL285_002896 [Trifolium repens]|nr:hypothetical protein QL285_002896 [Trifolium repens]